jgi:hypothetical protein
MEVIGYDTVSQNFHPEKPSQDAETMFKTCAQDPEVETEPRGVHSYPKVR